MSEKIGKLLTCDRCGNTAFKEYTGEGVLDGGFTRYITYEDTPEGWSKMNDNDLCPECSKQFNKMQQDFMKNAESGLIKCSRF